MADEEKTADALYTETEAMIAEADAMVAECFEDAVDVLMMRVMAQQELLAAYQSEMTSVCIGLAKSKEASAAMALGSMKDLLVFNPEHYDSMTRAEFVEACRDSVDFLDKGQEDLEVLRSLINRGVGRLRSELRSCRVENRELVARVRAGSGEVDEAEGEADA